MRVDPDDRFSRLRLISWWDQPRVRGARLLLVGAGAIGNEVLKNCALLGLGRIVVVDMDRVEASNLTRSVLFRPDDEGRPKTEAAARGARALWSELPVQPLQGDVNADVGLGLFRWADVVIGALDNREARLAINRACYRVGRPWVDGGIDVLSGIARVFSPAADAEGPCYECTMSEADWRALEQRRSCALLMREVVRLGHVPTTPTTASVVGAVQVQEVLKLLHGMPTLAGGGWVFEGLGHGSYVTSYQRDPACGSHDPLAEVHELDRSTRDVTLGEALGWAREALGPGATLELARELVEALECPECGAVERRARALSGLTEADGECPDCGARRAPRLFHSVGGAQSGAADGGSSREAGERARRTHRTAGGEAHDDALLGRTLAEVGVPPWDIVIGRAGDRAIGFELRADRRAVLGAAASDDDGGGAA